MYLLGLDIGTSGCKSILFDLDGKKIASASGEYGLRHPKPGWAELNPIEVWEQITITIKKSIRKLDGKKIKALSISSLGHAIMPVDRDGIWLYPTIQRYDQRAKSQIVELQNRIEPEMLLKITGEPKVQAPIAHIMWIRDNMPNIYRKAKFLGWHEYVVWRLCGKPVIDYSLASCLGVFDKTRNTWSSEILEAAQIDVDHLPEIESSGSIVGEVSAEAEKETGLAKGTSVVVGGHDTDVSALGAGAIEEGIWMDLAGTFEIIFAPVSKRSSSTKILCGKINRSKDILVDSARIPSSGSVLKWFKDILSQEEIRKAKDANRNIYDILIEKAATARPGSNKLFLLPHFANLPGGFSKGALVGLTLHHQKKEVIRALLEGVAYELRRCFEELENKGLAANEIRAIGGGAKSRFWTQLKANITQKKIVCPENLEGGSLGAAILAGIGVEEYSNAVDGVSHTFNAGLIYQPDEEESRLYERSYETYRLIHPALQKIFSDIDSI